MPNFEDKLKLATRILSLRAELAAAEVAFAGTEAPKPRPGGPHGKGPTNAPSISERVLHLVREAGRTGINRRDILAVIPNESAVHSALRTHTKAGRIHNDGGQWVSGHQTREIRVPTEAFQGQ